VAQAMEQVTATLGERGRLLVRYSGTEPLVRVMVEGEDEKMVTVCAQAVADSVQKHLGI
jgi:phosphoglucosamine mutase